MTSLHPICKINHIKVLLPMILCVICFSVGANAQNTAQQNSTHTENIPISNIAQWKISGVNAEKLQMKIDGGNLVLHWPGGPGQAIIEHANAVPVKPLLHDGFIRYRGKVNILSDEYGSLFRIQILPLDSNGKRDRT